MYLRATLPPKPGTQKEQPHQQEIALGIYANPAGFKRAKAEAIVIGGLLACKEFSWEPYLKQNSVSATPKTCREWAEEFEQDYFTRRARTPKSETTFREYRLVLHRLPADAPLTAEVMKQLIFATPPDTRTRKRVCSVMKQLATLAEIELEVKAYTGSYSSAKALPRNLPEDALIAEWRFCFADASRSHITNRAWQWVYGMLAVYGLRPHEIFNLDLESLRSSEKVLNILDGKTGSRRVWPFPLEWWERWQLWDVCLPAVTGQCNADYGRRVQQFFKRSGIPFRPYDLRHAWAVRTLEYGLDLTLAAQQMGHSVAIHTCVYHHWISEKHHQRAFDALMSKPNRPAVP